LCRGLHDVAVDHVKGRVRKLNADATGGRPPLRGHLCSERTREFCAKYAGPAFDLHGETAPRSFFEPIRCRVSARPKRTIYTYLQD
jgi:hypothetical protein